MDRSRELTKPNPLLALRFRWIVSDPEVTRRITAPFAALFAPLMVVIVVLAFALISGWVLFTKGLGSATHQAFDQPILLVVVFAITIFSAGFHEFGHASACRYGGATPGAMGTGLYLVWPAFYTDVTDSYRLGRAGRLRVDLGGLYFNALVTVAMFGVWLVTGWDALLLILAAQLLQMVRQLAPMVRFDGYHVLADLTGVPDLASRIGPTLRGLVPGREPEARAAELKRWARVVVTTWVLVIVPLLLVTLVLMVVALPRVVGTAWTSVLKQEHALALDWAGGDLVGVAIRVLSIVAVSLPVLGSLFVLARLVKTVTNSLWTRTAGRPGRRALASILVVAVAAALTWAWWPDANRYRPVQSFEKGTLVEGLSPASFVGGSPRLQDGQIREGQPSVWASTTAPPTKDHPQLALVLVPRSTSSAGAEGAAPAWVFPFNRPGAPGTGDNQALAVNTTDGSTTYDVAFALVWADGTSVTNSNSAYAFASCRQCKTVAVAFQVVLMTGDAHVVIPQNISGAVNYSCAKCLTYALAQQPRPHRPRRAQRNDPTADRGAVAADRRVRHHGAGPSPRRDPHPTAGLPEPDPGAGDRGAGDDDSRPGRDSHHSSTTSATPGRDRHRDGDARRTDQSAPGAPVPPPSATTPVQAPTTETPSPTSPATATTAVGTQSGAASSPSATP